MGAFIRLNVSFLINRPDCRASVNLNKSFAVEYMPPRALPGYFCKKGLAGAENVALNLKLNIDTGLVTISWQGPEGFSSSYLGPPVYRVGLYIVTILDDQGCTITDTLEVLAADKPDIQAKGGHILCSQGRLRICASTSIINPIFEWVGSVWFRSNLPDR